MGQSTVRRGAAALSLVVALASMVVVPWALAQTGASGSFIDDDGNTHESQIEAIALVGITKGCNPPVNDLYCPGDEVTRGQMAAFLVRALGLTEEPKGDSFVDDNGNTFEADIQKLAFAGITKGCNPPTNDRFCPNDPITRGQMAAFLVRAFGYSDDGGGDLFLDDDGNTFEADIDKLGTAGVTKGCNPPTNDRFCPNDTVKRDQMASFLARALSLPILPPPSGGTTSTSTGGGNGTTTTGGGGTTTTTGGGGTPPGSWIISTVDDRANVGQNTSLAIVNALGIISYRDNGSNQLAAARCTNTACSSAATITNVDTAGLTGLGTSIAIANSLPVIAYYDLGNLDLKVARCTNVSCTAATITAVDSTGSVGTDSAITVIDGLPVISYYDATNSNLKVVRCGTVDCSSGNTITTVDSTGDVGRYSSIVATADGLPIISYYDASGKNVKVAFCTNVTCSAKTIQSAGDTTGDVGWFTSIALVGGVPQISYYDATNGDLKWIRCPSTSSCTGGIERILDGDGNGGVGEYTSITEGADGFAWVSYYDQTNGNLKFVDCADAFCATKTISTIDSTGDVGKWTSVKKLGDFPLISYFDETNDDLKVARGQA